MTFALRLDESQPAKIGDFNDDLVEFGGNSSIPAEFK
jgi:hypothetical protein